MKIGEANKFQKDNGILVSCICAYVGVPVPPTVHALIRSCKRLGIQIRLFAVDKEYQGHWITKLLELKNCLEACKNEYQWVLNMDAYDSVIIRPLEEMMQYTIADRMLFAAERNCYPDEKMQYPACSTSYRYLNGGGFFAPISVALECMNWHKPNAYNCDQYAWSLAYNSGLPISLDHHCNLFQTLWGHGEGDFELCHDRIINKETRTFPCVIHGNGNNFENPVIRRFW